MADRVLRGSRLGAVSYETDRNHDLAPRQVARYRTDNGEEFEVPFADDAEIPGASLRLITHRARQRDLDATVEALAALDAVHEVASVLRVEGN